MSQLTTEELTEPRKPILLLFFLSPLIGEGLSGSTPPLAFLNPAVTFLLASLYSSDAGALGFFALFLDFILALFLGRIGTSFLGVAFVIYLLWVRKNILAPFPIVGGSVQHRSDLPEPIVPSGR